MGRLNRFSILLSLLAVIALLTSCGNSQAYGKIKKISNSKITIETGSYNAAFESDGNGAKAAAENTEGGFKSDGGSAEYDLSEDIDSSSLVEGTCVKLTLKEGVVMAIETLLSSKSEMEDSQKSKDQSKNTGQSALLFVDDEKANASGRNYDTHKPNANTVHVGNHGSIQIDGSTLTKSGDTTNETGSRLHGLNAVLTVSEGGTAHIDNTTLTSGGTGANALFATGKGTKITATDININTTGNASSGVGATYGGSIHAEEMDITTKGTNSPAIAIDEPQGNVKAANTTISSEGKDSPCIRAEGSVKAMWVKGGALRSPIALIADKGKVMLDSCILRGSGQSGILFKGDGTEMEKGFFHAVDSQLTTTCSGPMLLVESGSFLAVMEHSTFYYSGDTFAKVISSLTLKGIEQTFKGDIVCQPGSHAKLKFVKNTFFEGALNKSNKAEFASVSMDASSTWNVMGTSYVHSLKNEDKQCRNIKSNGHTIYYDSNHKDNAWLNGQLLSLPGNGKLVPAN